jgi:hypothetical protein
MTQAWLYGRLVLLAACIVGVSYCIYLESR